MQRQRGELVPIGEVVADLDGPVKAIREASPQARHHFTRFDQVNQLVAASEADADLGFMARMMALCSLPRTNPGNRLQYKRVNGPFKLIMIAGGDNKLPYGNLPRLILAWVSTEAVRTRSRVIVLGPSLANPGVGAGRNRKPASGLKKLKIGPQRGSFDLYAAPWGGGSSLTADRLHTL